MTSGGKPWLYEGPQPPAPARPPPAQAAPIHTHTYPGSHQVPASCHQPTPDRGLPTGPLPRLRPSPGPRPDPQRPPQLPAGPPYGSSAHLLQPPPAAVIHTCHLALSLVPCPHLPSIWLIFPSRLSRPHGTNLSSPQQPCLHFPATSSWDHPEVWVPRGQGHVPFRSPQGRVQFRGSAHTSGPRGPTRGQDSSGRPGRQVRQDRPRSSPTTRPAWEPSRDTARWLTRAARRMSRPGACAKAVGTRGAATMPTPGPREDSAQPGGQTTKLSCCPGTCLGGDREGLILCPKPHPC